MTCVPYFLLKILCVNYCELCYKKTQCPYEHPWLQINSLSATSSPRPPLSPSPPPIVAIAVVIAPAITIVFVASTRRRPTAIPQCEQIVCSNEFWCTEFWGSLLFWQKHTHNPTHLCMKELVMDFFVNGCLRLTNTHYIEYLSHQ